MEHAEYSIKGVNAKYFPEQLQNEINPATEYRSATGKTYFVVYEQYSFLQNSEMGIILLVDIVNDDECVIKAVIAGGKAGLFSLDPFGREKSKLNEVREILEEICQNNNWQISDAESDPV